MTMRIEEVIKQKVPFSDQRQRAMVNLIYTCNWLMGEHKKAFKPYGITVQQFNVLRILRGQHPQPISTSDIRERMLDKMSDVSRIIDRLVKKNLVIRKTCKSDKRLVDLLITDTGLDLLAAIDRDQITSLGLFSHLSQEELETLNDLLDKVRG
ncbi:MAG: MarR family transcriptional regulator [Bacteroidota bacterium]